MELTVEQEAQLAQIAGQTGRSAVDLVQEALARYIAKEFRFCVAVQAGLEAAERGGFVPTSEVWAMVERALKA